MLPKGPATQILDWWLIMEEMWRSHSAAWTNIWIPKLVGCVPQFWFEFMSKLLTLIHYEIDLEWHYNEAHLGKEPMDGIGGTRKTPFSAKSFQAKLWLAVQKNSPDMLIRSANSIHYTFRQLKFQTSLRMYSIHLQYLIR